MSSLPDLTGDLSLLSPRDMRLYLDDFDDLTLDLRGEIHERIGVQRAFPLNAPTKFIVLHDSDGSEIWHCKRPGRSRPRQPRCIGNSTRTGVFHAAHSKNK